MMGLIPRFAGQWLKVWRMQSLDRHRGMFHSDHWVHLLELLQLLSCSLLAPPNKLCFHKNSSIQRADWSLVPHDNSGYKFLPLLNLLLRFLLISSSDGGENLCTLICCFFQLIKRAYHIVVFLQPLLALFFRSQSRRFVKLLELHFLLLLLLCHSIAHQTRHHRHWTLQLLLFHVIIPLAHYSWESFRLLSWPDMMPHHRVLRTQGAYHSSGYFSPAHWLVRAGRGLSLSFVTAISIMASMLVEVQRYNLMRFLLLF